MRDNAAVGLHDARGDVGLQAAEGDGDAGVQSERGELRSLDGVQELGGLAEVLVDALLDQLAVAVIGGLEHGGVDLYLLGQLLDAVGDGVAALALDRLLEAVLHSGVRLVAAGDVPAAVAARAG